jgi:hypothetical protein
MKQKTLDAIGIEGYFYSTFYITQSVLLIGNKYVNNAPVIAPI